MFKRQEKLLLTSRVWCRCSGWWRPAFGLLLGLGVAYGAAAGPVPGRGSSDGWLELYWRWFYGNITLPVDHNGNAVVKQVVMMPLPAAPSDGTPGHQDVTLDAGQSWVLPLLGLPGTSYTDGTPPDPLVDLEFFRTLDVSFQVDGQTIVNTQDVMQYYVPINLDPPIPYYYPPLAAIIWIQGLGLVHQPLSVGTHTLKLDIRDTEPLPPTFGGGFIEFHNTWTVSVQTPATPGSD